MAKSNPLAQCLMKSIIATVLIAPLALCETSTVSGEPLKLAYTCIHTTGTKEKEDLTPVILLHGLTDSKKSWHGIYQVLAMKAGRRICIVDARNHGDSPWSDEMTLDSMADDVEHLMDHLKIPKAVFIGHSMGGKTAMLLALKKPDRVDKIVVEDMRPNGVVPEALQFVTVFLKMLNDSISTVPKGSNEDEAKAVILDYFKKQLEALGMKDALPPNLSDFLSVDCSTEICRWKANMDVLVNVMKDPNKFLRDIEGKFLGNALFIYGELSPFKVFEDKENILKLFPKAKLVGIKGAGHDIHRNFPEFTDEVINFLQS